MVLGGKRSDGSSDKTLCPFPDLEKYNGMMIPWYDLTEQIKAGDSKFIDKYNFIGTNSKTIWRITISLSVFSSVFFVLGLLVLILWILKGEDEEGYPLKRSSLLRSHGEF